MNMGAAIGMTTAGAATAAPAAMYAAIASGSAAAGRSVQAVSSTPTLRQAMLQPPPTRAARLPMTMYLHFSLTDYFLIESLQLTSPKGVQLQLCTVPNEQQQFSYLRVSLSKSATIHGERFESLSVE